MKGFIGMHERLKFIENLVDQETNESCVVYGYKKNGTPLGAHPTQLEKALEVFRWIMEGES